MPPNNTSSNPDHNNPWNPYVIYNDGTRNPTYALAYALKYKQNKHWYKLDSM